ncbi:hypothetical protein BJ322DRAFT_1018139 [Thelephora terrestris]|uniref:Uncharacterized protein n=1 Tax=Thelephora terrestris TaxID=56493 RepID=A0A9P6HKW9_9AGAM|nr:hypothetical protein BJ322DRAFT_1018139 [Thelephora terrestris]
MSSSANSAAVKGNTGRAASTNPASTTIINKLQSASREANVLTPERTRKVYPPESGTCNPRLIRSDARKPIDPYPVRQKDFFFRAPYLLFAKISRGNTAIYTRPRCPQYLDEIYPEEEQIRDQALDRMDDQASLWLPDMIFVNRCWASTIIHAQEEGNEFLQLRAHIERGLTDIGKEELPMANPDVLRSIQYAAAMGGMLFDYNNMLNRENHQLRGQIQEMEESMETEQGRHRDLERTVDHLSSRVTTMESTLNAVGPLVLVALHGSGSPEDLSALADDEGRSPAGPTRTGQRAHRGKDKHGPYSRADRLGKGRLVPIESEASGSGGTSYQSVLRTDGSMPSSPLPTPIPPPEEHRSTLDPWMSDLQDIPVSELIAVAEEAEAMDRAQSRAIP